MRDHMDYVVAIRTLLIAYDMCDTGKLQILQYRKIVFCFQINFD